MSWLKAVVLALALANAGYWLWTRGVGAPERSDAPAAEPAVPTLRLISEGAGAGVGASRPPIEATDPAAAGPSVSAPAPTIASSDAKRCITVGPFPDVSEAAHAAATLRGGGYSPRERVAEGDVWVGVWVYIPMPATAAAADQLRSKLKAGGIDDILEMPGPNDKPVISLGLYGEPKRAQARAAQAQQLGLNPGIADRKRAGNVYWVDVDLKPTDALLNPADLQAESGRIVRLEVKTCPPPSPSP